MSKWFDILRTGTFRDSEGREHTFSPADLDRIVSMYSSPAREAPIVVGHPRTDSPAWGWVDKLRRVGDRLQALPKQLVTEFVDANRRGMYKTVSVALYPDGALRHVGFLGGMPPAVPGLTGVMFALAPEAYAIEYALDQDQLVPGKLSTLAAIMKRLRDWLIEKNGVEGADKIIPPWEIEQLERTPPPEIVEPVPTEGNFSEMKEEPMKTENLPAPPGAGSGGEFAEATALRTENETLKRQLQQAKDKDAERDRQDQERNRQAKRQDAITFAAGLKTAGRLLPRHESAVVEALVILQDQDVTIEFAEGGKTEQRPIATAVREFLGTLPVVLPTESTTPQSKGGAAANRGSVEFAAGNVNQERLELHRKALAMQESSKTPLSYPDAVRAVIKTEGGN